ncbi:hypothetical protein [Streptomyces sp. NPDC057579]|uniref:hypothetical protein n=1 Tax=Streptomyces sp. NPDC057579 TaxID=3346172 RepID=UPI00369E3B84
MLLTFFVALPFPCPVGHGAVIARAFDEPLRGCEGLEMRVTEELPPLETADSKIFASLKFWQLKETVDVADSLNGLLQVVHTVTGIGKVPDKRVPAPQETYRTVVEMVTVQNSDTLDDMEAAITEAFTRCFGVLSDVYSMSQLVKRENVSPRLGVEEAQLVFWFGRYPDQGYNDDFGGMFWVSPPPHYPEETINEEEFKQLQALLGRVWSGSPLELMMEHSLMAWQYLERQGDYGNAVIHGALASEILLDSLLGLMLWEEQLNSPDFDAAAAVFDEAKNGGLATRVRREYGPRLGGNWNPGVDGPVRRWSADLARVRGRVVHRGYRPLRAEAERALDAGDGLLEFVKERLAARTDRYPRTSLMILGEPGLRRVGGWGRVSKFLDGNEEESLSWFSGYSEWRDAVDSMRT